MKDIHFKKIPAKYPWADWLNGSTWALVRGQHFKSSMISFLALANRKAAAKGLKLETEVVGDSVRMTARPLTDAELGLE